MPGKQNQDAYFTYQSVDGQTIIVGVLDGHGRELGQVSFFFSTRKLNTTYQRKVIRLFRINYWVIINGEIV